MSDSLAIKKHREWNGKIEVIPKAPVSTLEELSTKFQIRWRDLSWAIS